jgi:rod shape-determining protein MreC
MERLLNFVYTYRAFFTFLLLEILCSWLIIQNNQFQSTKYFNSSDRLFARIHATSQNIRDYFSLAEVNYTLAEENAFLRKRLEQRNELIKAMPASAIKDSARIKQYDFVSAKVVNNTTKYYKNFITIDRGEDAGLQPGMAVISAGYAVGKVKTVSKHFSVLISLLNLDEQVSCIIKRTGHFGTAQWDGTDPALINLKYIPRHVMPAVGDSVVTSGYNAVFPAGTYVGKIKEVKLKEEALFYDIKIELAQDFGKLAFVEVIKSNLKKEKDSLEQVTTGELK